MSDDRALRERLAPPLLIRPGEVAGILFLAGNAILMSAAVVALARVAASRVADRVPVEATALISVATLVTVIGYLVVVRRCKRLTLSFILTGLTVLGLLVGLGVARGHNGVSTPAAAVLLVLVVRSTVFLVLCGHTTALAADVLSVDPGMRLVAWLAVGVGAGTWIGRWSAIELYAAWGPAGAIALAVACLAAALALTWGGSRHWPQAAEVDAPAGAAQAGDAPTPWAYLASAVCLFLLVRLAVGSAEALWEARLLALPGGPAVLQASKANIRLIGGGSALLLQIVVLTWWLRRVGVRGTLLVLVATVAATLVPLAVLFGNRVPFPLAWTPVVAAALETPLLCVFFVLWLPLPRATKYGPMVAIGVLASAAGPVLGAAVAGFVTLEVLTSQQAAMVGIAACALALPVALAVGRGFSRMVAMHEGSLSSSEVSS